MSRLFSAAVDRNKLSILEVLQQVLPTTGRVLEIASGSGQHAAFFAPRLSPRYWQPSEPQPALRTSIQAWAAESPSAYLLPPLTIDVNDPDWPEAVPSTEQTDLPSLRDKIELPDVVAIVNINMIHIAPWPTGLGLLTGAQQILSAGGILYLYGPFRREGRHTAESNAHFDQWLRSQNPNWGVRDLETVISAAADSGFQLKSIIDMPANNLSVVFRYP